MQKLSNKIAQFVGLGTVTIAAAVTLRFPWQPTWPDTSVVEHALSGFGLPMFMYAVLAVMFFVGKRPLRPTLIVQMAFLSIPPLTYICGSLGHEWQQALTRGFFQWDQFAMDIVGAAIAVLLARKVLLTDNHQQPAAIH